MAELTFRCPESICIGWVSEIDDEDGTFWGCGECGTVWDDREELNQAISEAIERHPYRKSCYRKTRRGWNPVPLEKEPEDYEELVEQEEVDEHGDQGDEFEEDEFLDGDDSCYRCPVPQCSGFACWEEEADIDGKPGWSCGYCGSLWFGTKNLLMVNLVYTS